MATIRQRGVVDKVTIKNTLLCNFGSVFLTVSFDIHSCIAIIATCIGDYFYCDVVSLNVF